MPYVSANVLGLVTRKKLTQDKADKALSMLKGVLEYSEFKDVDMVIEVGSSTYVCQSRARIELVKYRVCIFCRKWEIEIKYSSAT